MTTTTLTPAQAFHSLVERAKKQGLPVPDAGDRCVSFSFDYLVPDQSVAFPSRRIELYSKLRVLATAEGQLHLYVDANWRSIYGLHVAESKYVITLDGDDVTIKPAWERLLPQPRLAHMDIHTGGVSVEQYHNATLNLFKGEGEFPITGMLLNRGELSAEPRRLPIIAEVVTQNVALL